MKFETRRLQLRSWKEGDAPSIFQYASDPAVGPIAGWPPHRTLGDSQDVLNLFLSKPECYAICLKPSDDPIGCVELKLQGSSDLVNNPKECELGYWLGKPFWGQGIMPEAVKEMLRHAFEDCGMERVWCGHYEGNLKSRRVMEKNGFTYRWTTENLEVPLMHETRTGHVFCIERDEWERQKEKEAEAS